MPRITGSYSEFHDLPRVPRAEGNVHNGIQVGVGGIPPDKVNISYGEPVDASVAMARMHSRKTGELPIIPGGIDDKDPSLFIKKDGCGILGKMKVAQGVALSAEDVERLKRGQPPNPTPLDKEAHDANDAHEVVLSPRAGYVIDAEPEGSSFGSPLPDPQVLGEDRRGDSFSLGGPAGHASEDLSNVVYRDRIVEKIVFKTVEKVVDSPFSEWVKKRVKVHITISETLFIVSAVDVIRSAHGITVILPTTDDGMAFIPKPGARVWLECKTDEVGPTETVFTGVSFDIMELGIMGLAFLIPKGSDG